MTEDYRPSGRTSNTIMAPAVSVVIPVLIDADSASALLATLRPGPGMEVIVVDGAADARLAGIVAAHPPARLLRTAPGRGRQMNAGAAAAAGTWLLFLHADSILPAGWFEAIAQLDDDVAGGWFRFALDDAAWQARVIERLTAWRVKSLRLPTVIRGYSFAARFSWSSVVSRTSH